VIDPPRLRDRGAEAPPELSELFQDAKKPEPLTPVTDARLLAQITSLGAAPAAPLINGWLMAGGAVVVAGALALVAQRDPAPGAAPILPPTQSASAPAAADVAPTASALEPQSPPEGQRAPAVSPAKVARVEAASSAEGAASPSEDALAGEAQLLNRAHAVMATDPRTAHAVASEHAKRYPRGQLAAERELILVEALVKLGRVREAEARGRALRKRAPSGIYGERLDTLLQGK
jgi:TolA-binding protein